VSAAAILYDSYARGRRQPVRIMEAVWPITALYTGPLGWFIYARLGRLRLVTAAQRRVPGPRQGPLPAEVRVGQRGDSASTAVSSSVSRYRAASSAGAV
jgi:hypothetical protein